MAVMNIFADLVYFILKANRIKKHFTYYLGVRKLLKSFFCFFFVRSCLWRELLSACILSTYFKIFLRSLRYSRNLLL